MSTLIKSVKARQVYSNRGKPGVEAVITTENGAVGRAMCTSGVSVGTHEVDFAFDGGKKFGGKGVRCVADRINTIAAPALIGVDTAIQLAADNAILNIGGNGKEALGGNATAALSAAVLKAGAAALGIPLYRHIGGAGAMYLPVPGVAMVAGDERYGGGITTPRRQAYNVGYGVRLSHIFRSLIRLLGGTHALCRENEKEIRRLAKYKGLYICARRNLQLR